MLSRRELRVANKNWYGDGSSMMNGWKNRGRKDFWNPEEGDTLAYVCPPCRDDDARNYYEVPVHYNVGEKNGMVVCLDPAKNPILSHPAVARLIVDKDISGGCPVCKAIDSGELDSKACDDMRFSWKYLWNIVPIAFRKSAREKWSQLEPAVVPLFCGQTIWDGICEVFANEGNITDFDNAIYVMINRKGTGKNGTKYTVKVDTDTIRKPVKMSDEMIELISSALAEGGANDAYQLVAKVIYSHQKASALLNGMEVDESDAEAEDDAEPATPVSFAENRKRMAPVAAPAPAAVAPHRVTTVLAKDAEPGELYQVKENVWAFKGLNDTGKAALFIDGEGVEKKVHPETKVSLIVGDAEEAEEELIGGPEEDEEELIGGPEEETPAPADPPAAVNPALAKIRAQLDAAKKKKQQ
jgi:hypothetical protein